MIINLRMTKTMLLLLFKNMW